MMKCDDRLHHNYAARLVKRWNARKEWCCSFSLCGEEAADLTNNFCESAFRYVRYYYEWSDFNINVI